MSIDYSCTGKAPNSKNFWGFSPDPTWRAYSCFATRITSASSFLKSCIRPRNGCYKVLRIKTQKHQRFSETSLF